MSAEARKKIPPVPAPAEPRPRRVRLAGALRSRGLLTSVPILLITTIAVTLNLASPADAATIFRKPLKVKSTVPESAPTPGTPPGRARPGPRRPCTGWSRVTPSAASLAGSACRPHPCSR